MPWTVEYVPEKEMVLVLGSGQVVNQDARAQAVAAFGLLKQNQVDSVLVDCSDARLEVSLANLYWLPEYYSELGAPQYVRIAVVLPRTRYKVESYQFYQIACKNAGYDVKLFDGKEAAEAWLHQYRPTTDRTLGHLAPEVRSTTPHGQRRR